MRRHRAASPFGPERARYLRCDVRTFRIATRPAEAQAAFGPSRAINNAARDAARIAEVTPEYWDEKSPPTAPSFLRCAGGGAGDAATGGGSIINMSGSGMRADRVRGYTTSKAAIYGLTRTARAGLGPPQHSPSTRSSRPR